MSRKPLQAVLDSVEQLLAAGSATASGDDRLPRHAATLRELSRQVPALASFADTLDRARQADPGQASRAWLDLIVLTRQVRVALGTDPLEGEVVPLPPSGPWTTDLSPAELSRLASALRGGSVSIQDTLRLDTILDLRLWPLMRPSLDAWGEAGNLAALRVLPRLGRPVLAELERGLDLAQRPGGGRRLSAVALIDFEAAVQLCLRRFPQEGGVFGLLARLGQPAVDLFVRVLANPHGNYANWDLERIGRDILAHPSWYPALIACLQDPEDDVQQAAAKALENLGMPRSEVVHDLIECLDHPKAFVRQAVVMALGKAAARNKTALQGLSAANKRERDPSVQRMIETVLGAKRGKK